jgi:hypothetical protein
MYNMEQPRELRLNERGASHAVLSLLLVIGCIAFWFPMHALRSFGRIVYDSIHNTKDDAKTSACQTGQAFM